MRDIIQRLDDAVDAMTAAVDDTADADWSRPSPCQGWTAADVLAHVCGTAEKLIGTLGGADYDPRPFQPGDATFDHDSAVSAWRGVAARIRAASDTTDLSAIVDTGRGPEPTHRAIVFPMMDIATHAWDIAAAAGRHLDLADTLLTAIRSVTGRIPDDVLRAPGLFGEAVAPASGASETDALMAWLGRVRPDAPRR